MGNPLGLLRFQQLYDTHISGAIALALLLTRERELAEDIAQEAFIKVARRFGDLRDPASFSAYLRRTIVNLTNSHMRRRRVERRYLTHAVEPSAEAPTSSSIEDGPLWSALIALPHRQRAAVVLRFCEDLSERQTAEILGTTEKAVRSLVSRATETLRKQLGGTTGWID